MSPGRPVPIVPPQAILGLGRVDAQAVQEGRGAVSEPPAACPLVGAVHPLALVHVVVEGREGLAVVVAEGVVGVAGKLSHRQLVLAVVADRKVIVAAKKALGLKLAPSS